MNRPPFDTKAKRDNATCAGTTGPGAKRRATQMRKPPFIKPAIERTPEEQWGLCEDCDEPIPGDSKSPYYCDSCFGYRVAERAEQEMNRALTNIARGIDKLDEAIEKLSKMSAFRQAE